MAGKDFLAGKSWHPGTAKNRERLRKAEEHEQSKKAKAAARQKELDDEREQQREARLMGREVNATAWMYAKPPGFRDGDEGATPTEKPNGSGDDPASRARREGRGETAGGSNRSGGGGNRGQIGTATAGATAALPTDNAEWTIPIGSREPIRGGCDPADANQQYLLSSSEDEDAGGGREASLEGKRRKHRRHHHRHHKRRRRRSHA